MVFATFFILSFSIYKSTYNTKRKAKGIPLLKVIILNVYGFKILKKSSLTLINMS
jgi:hypothetical protein